VTKTIVLTISLQGQGLSGSDALEVRNAIEEQIESGTSSQVVGAGGNVDGTEIDLQVQTSQVEETITFIDGLMKHSELDDNFTTEIK